MAYKVSKTRANSDFILKNDCETMIEIQDFEQEMFSMSPPKMTRPTDSPEQNGKVHIPGNPDLYPPLS